MYVEYSTKRIPKAGVHINTESSFLTCCNCEDDCQVRHITEECLCLEEHECSTSTLQDKDKCACWQLTIQSTAASGDGKVRRVSELLIGPHTQPVTKFSFVQVDPSVGYRHRRLVEAVQTGIFECNSLCSCKKTCLNR